MVDTEPPLGINKNSQKSKPRMAKPLRPFASLASSCSRIILLLILYECHTSFALFGIPDTFKSRRRLNSQQPLFQRHQSVAPEKESILSTPKHVAFICDGNSRWAEERYLPASVGHAVGADRLLNCFEALKKRGIQCCTVYGFSTENWRRSRDEVRDILTVIEGTARKFEHRAIEEGVRVKILGDMTDERLPRSLSNALLSLESKTHAATKHLESDDCLTVCLAVNYGGRHDILNASIKLATRIVEEKLDPKSLTESDFAVCLYTATIPEPDLVVRTGGDQRLSNFLLWDVSYAELYFTDVLWPDFDETELSRALSWFANRSRRFGGRKIPAFESLT